MYIIYTEDAVDQVSVKLWGLEIPVDKCRERE